VTYCSQWTFDVPDPISEMADTLYAGIREVSPRPVRARPVRPKGANDEEVQQCPDSVCGHRMPIKLRAAKHGSMLRPRLPNVYDEQTGTTGEPDVCELHTCEIRKQPGRRGSRPGLREESDRSGPIVAFIACRRAVQAAEPARGQPCGDLRLDPFGPGGQRLPGSATGF
jgi:hypothetical protein